MYKVYADDVLIHYSVSPSKEVHLIEPNLTIADSAAGSFTFTMSPYNAGYDSIERFTTTIIVYENDSIIWTGRVTTQTEDFWKRRKFTCEGALAFLNDSQQPLKYYKNMNSDAFFTALITLHNSRVPSNRQFNIGEISQHDRYDPYNYKTEYKSTFETIKSEFKDNLGGHIRVIYSGNDPKPIIEYLDEDYRNTPSQVINFGENLLDFTKNWDVTNLVTVIIPRGKQLEEDNEEGDKDYVTIKSVNSGSIYLKNNTTVAKYGEVERVVDFDTDDPSFLKTLGQNYLSSTQFDEMVLEVSAVDLHNINESIQSFKLLDTVRCVSTPHGLDREFPITQIDIPLDKLEGIKYTMGTNVTQAMSAQTSTGKSFDSKLNLGLADTLAAAKRNAAKVLNAVTTGYVNIISENEVSQALVITNTPDFENATRYWKFNMNGLGYTNDGGETYEMALDFTGTVTANYMHVGLIDDGTGYNWWNLTKGEFQMAWNSNVANSSGNTIQVIDIVQLAQDGVDDAADAMEVADTAMHKQTGGTNILNGTNKNLTVVTNKNSNWADSTWDGNLGASATKKVVDISGVPNSAIIKSFYIQLKASNSESFVVQRNVKVVADQVYVISCYAKGTGKLSIGYFYGNGEISRTQLDLTNDWKRYSTVFRVAEGKTSANIVFGLTGNLNNTVYICGMQLERGNTPSDWSESEQDTYDISTEASAEYTDATADELKTYTVEYTDTISKNDREFTKSQRQALDESFNQQKVLQRLTNNYKAKGLYLQNNELYINATYIRTGTLDAGIVKAGILTDKYQTNKWNMATGYLYTKNMEAVNIRASGRFECGDYYKIVNDGGQITGYRNKSTYVGSIEPTATIRNLRTGSNMYGLMIRASGHLDIRTPSMGIRDRNDNGTSTLCYTGTFSFECVRGLRETGNGGLSWYNDTHSIQIINGLIVAIA